MHTHFLEYILDYSAYIFLFNGISFFCALQLPDGCRICSGPVLKLESLRAILNFDLTFHFSVHERLPHCGAKPNVSAKFQLAVKCMTRSVIITSCTSAALDLLAGPADPSDSIKHRFEASAYKRDSTMT